MIELRVARGSRPTGRLLGQLLAARGLQSTGAETERFAAPHRATGVVCYGYGYSGPLPALNKRAGMRDKLEEIAHLHGQGVRVPTFYQGHAAPREYPLLGRRRNHVGGTDIVPILDAEGFRYAHQRGIDFVTRYIPSNREFRVWVYRRQHLGTYEKVLTRPQQYRSIGRNYDNGFSFQLVGADNIPRPAVDAASAAVTALGLDFGAVDIIQGVDGQFYVLEVNTAPGVEGPDRQVIQSLANKITRWVELGYPRRNGEADVRELPARRH